MADFTLECPHCNQSLEVPVELAGETVACPACEQPIALPAVEMVEDADGADDADGTVCPECQATLADGAVLCVSCGYHLTLGRKLDTEIG